MTLGWRARLATRADDAALRALVRGVSMEGAVGLAQDRDPDFFAFLACHEGRVESYVAESDAGEVVACGTLVVRDAWWPDGEVRPVGYVCDLRALPAWRGAKVLPELGRHALERARDEQDCHVSLTAVIDSNRRVVRTATSQRPDRARQPRAAPVCRYDMVNVHWMRGDADAVEACDDLDEVAAFLDRHERARTFGHVVTRKELERRVATWGGLEFLVVRRGGRIAACGAPWSSAATKRMRVTSYGPAMRTYRAAWNVSASALGRPLLPTVGEAFRYHTLSHLTVDNEDPRLLRALLRGAWARAEGAHFLATMVPRGSSLAGAFRGAWAHRTPMTLFSLTLPESAGTTDHLTTTNPGFEMALA